MVGGVNLLRRDICIGKESFQPVPFRIGFKFAVIDSHPDVAFHFKELVVASLVHVFFRKSSTAVCLFQAAYSLFPVIGILTGTVVAISNQQPSPVAFVIFNHPFVGLRLLKYPFLYLSALVLDFCTNNILVAVCFKFRYIIAVHQPGVCHDYEVFQLVFPDKFRHCRQHRVPFVLVPLMDAIGQRIASVTYKQTEYDLWVLVPPFFGKSRFPQFILIIRLKIEGGYVIEQNTDMTVKYPPCMLHAYILYDFMLIIAEFVQITVYL